MRSSARFGRNRAEVLSYVRPDARDASLTHKPQRRAFETAYWTDGPGQSPDRVPMDASPSFGVKDTPEEIER